VCNLNNIFNEKSMIELYERGYGKDPAGLARQAINYGKFSFIIIENFLFCFYSES
jgi:hypothetical protein